MIRNFITSLRLYSGKIIDFAFTSFKIMNYVISIPGSAGPAQRIYYAYGFILAEI